MLVSLVPSGATATLLMSLLSQWQACETRARVRVMVGMGATASGHSASERGFYMLFSPTWAVENPRSCYKLANERASSHELFKRAVKHES